MENPNKLKQFPILITLIIGMSGWLISYLIANVKDKPIIEYTTEQQLIGDTIQYTYTFENISNTKIYKNITISFDSKPRCHFTKKSREPITDFGNDNIRFISLMDLHIKDYTTTIDLNIDNFQPNTKLGAEMKILKTSKIKLTYTGDTPILLTTPTLETFFIKNETIIFFSLLLLYGTIMSFYLLINYKKL
jgi:hypothetical protein